MSDHCLVRCLVVDDDHAGGVILGELLQLLGAQICVVQSGQAAIAVAPRFKPQMVVLDINMPGFDGLATCRALKQQPWSHAAVFIAYSGMPDARSAALAAGFDYVVAKGDSPLVFETVLEQLQAAD